MAEVLSPAANISNFYYKEYINLTPDFDYYDDFDEDSVEGSPNNSPSLPATYQ